MAPKADINSRTVIGALHTLAERQNGRVARADARWPTADELAAYLCVETAEVLVHLRALKRQRMFDSRQRSGKRVWMPWERCH